METVITEVEDRKGERIQTVAEYFRHRRENIGVRPTYYAGELYLNLPDEAFYHPVTKDIEYVIAELGSIDNVRSFVGLFLRTDLRELNMSMSRTCCLTTRSNRWTTLTVTF